MAEALSLHTSLKFHDFFELCKPRVVMLMLITSLVAMFLAVPAGEWPPFDTIILGNFGIALAGFAGGVINHIVDRKIDALMARTQKRPIASGRVPLKWASMQALVLALAGMYVLAVYVNPLTAVLSFFTLIGYAGVYTLFLKRATPQNIVIGGLAGAMPPLLGWTAVTHRIEPMALLLVLIIFTWTPPHFWSLAIYRHEEYAKAKIPMLPVTHGIRYTQLNILFYTLLMIACTYLPFAIMATGLLYCIGVTLLNIGFLYHVARIWISKDLRWAWRTFHYSITYLFGVFVILLVDHYCK